jgi:DNA-binding NarL/FixJ family response regulator
VVDLGQIWVGKSVMQRLVAGSRNMPKPAEEPAQAWDAGLTEREREVAVLAANGASNLAIARDCGISERTVKAHLSAVFTKLNLTDRLQLALRVHGIS